MKNAHDRIWKYWNTHVYDNWDTQIQELLMKLSIFENFDIKMAMHMTGNSNVNVILNQAVELGNFISCEDGIWCIRKGMRLSMFQRLNEKYNMDYIRNIYIRAGDCFRIKNQFVDALKMYEKANAEQEIAELLVQNARENPGSGLYYEMKYYYLKLSEEYIKQSVELMGAMSLLQSMLMNEEESERWYHELEKFADQQSGFLKREAVYKLLYLDIALPHRGSKNLFEIFQKIGDGVTNRKIKFPEFSVTSNLPSQLNGGKDLCEWTKNSKEIIKSIGKILETVLGKHGKAFESLGLSECGLEKGENNYEVETLAIRGGMEAETEDKLEQTFVSRAIIAWLSVLSNNSENAMTNIEGFYKVLNKNNVPPMLLKNISAIRCRIMLYQGKTEEIEQWMEEAPDEKVEFYTLERFRYLTKIRVYIGENRCEEAVNLIEEMEYYAQKMSRAYISMELKLLKAILYYRMENNTWKMLMQEVIASAENFHFVRIISREGAAVWPLLKNSEYVWKDSKYKKQVETEVENMAKYYPNYLKIDKNSQPVLLHDNALEILKLQSTGMTTDQIAKELHISVATVKYHNKETYKKLGVKTKVQAINEARNRKII